MNDVLNISGLTYDRGFVSSSSDDERLSLRSDNDSRAMSSNLAKIFGREADKKPSVENANVPSVAAVNSTIYSTVINFFLLENNEYTSKGKCGLAIISKNDYPVLLIYNAAKEKLVYFVLKKQLISIIVKDLYINISSSKISCSLLCTDLNIVQDVCALVSILSETPSIILKEGEGEPCPFGATIMYTARAIEYKDGSLLKDDECDRHTTKISKKSEDFIQSIAGLTKGTVMIFRLSSSSAIIFALKKWKIGSKPQQKEKEESISVEFHEETNDAFSEEILDVDSSKNETSIKKRMARLGQPIFPDMNSSVTMNKDDTQSTVVLTKEDTQPAVQLSREDTQSTAAPVSCPKLENAELKENSSHLDSSMTFSFVEDYSNMHRVVGIEIDRLQIRLEACMQNMFSRIVEPIKKDMAELKEQQNLLNSKLDDILKALQDKDNKFVNQ